MRRAAVRFAALLTASIVTSLAHADEGSDARARYQTGVAAFERGEYGASADAFRDVYRATGETKHLWNLAIAEYEAKRAFAATAHLREYAGKADASPKNVARAEKLLAELAPKLAHLRVTAPDGAMIAIDGANVGTAPLAAPVDVDPDAPHAVTARRGGDEAKKELAAPGAKDVAVDLAFAAAAPVTAVPPVAPVRTPPAAPSEPATASAAAPSPAPSPDDAPAVHHGSGLRMWLTVGLGVGALAAAGGGFAFGAMSRSDRDDAARIRGQIGPRTCPSAPGCADLQSALSSQDAHDTTSNVLYVGAGALAAGALASFLFLPRGEANAKSGALIPIVARDAAGAAFTGVF